MQNPIKTTYNFIKNLKQYHAIHVCIWPTFSFFIFLCCLFIGDLIHPIQPLVNNDEIHAYCFGLGLLIYFIFAVVFFFTVCALIVETLIFTIQTVIQKKIVIRWNFIINNPFFNFVFFIALIIYIIALIMLIYLRFH